MQSWVSYGHVGNASALFPLQRLGAEVWAVHTVQLSNHTGYGDWTGQVFGAGAVRDLIRGIAVRGALERLDAVLSGYLGDAEVGEAILETVAQARRFNPRLLYCCDPVMGDIGRGLFVRPGIPALFEQQGVPASDILTPNQFELEQLTGIGCESSAGVLRAVRSLQNRMRGDGPRLVLVTSLCHREIPPGIIEMLAASPQQCWRLRTPALAISPNGAGDLIAALFLFHILAGRGLRQSLERAVASTWGVLDHTVSAGSTELQLVAAQQELVTPGRTFDAELVDQD